MNDIQGKSRRWNGENDPLKPNEEWCNPPIPIASPGLAMLDPTISKSGSPLSAMVGEQVTYTIVISNPHDQTLNNIVVNDPIPSIFDVVNVMTTRGTSTVSGQTVTVDIGTLQSGEQATITVVVRGNATAQPGLVCNTATAGNTQAEGCVTLLPNLLPATGGRPVQNVPVLWVVIGAGAAVIGGMAFGLKRVQ